MQARECVDFLTEQLAQAEGYHGEAVRVSQPLSYSGSNTASPPVV